MISSDMCSCCNDIWNRQNLKKIPLGKHELHLCPDCYAEYIKPFNNIRAEVEGKIIKRPWLDFEDRERDRNDAFLEVLNIIDKYKTKK